MPPSIQAEGKRPTPFKPPERKENVVFSLPPEIIKSQAPNLYKKQPPQFAPVVPPMVLFVPNARDMSILLFYK